MRYAITLGRTRGARAEEITVAGQPIEADPERIFVLATASFVRGPPQPEKRTPAPHFPEPPFDLASPREHTPLIVRDLLRAHILAHGGVLPVGGPRRDGGVRVLE